jgi:hypothetical protein
VCKFKKSPISVFRIEDEKFIPVSFIGAVIFALVISDILIWIKYAAESGEFINLYWSVMASSMLFPSSLEDQKYLSKGKARRAFRQSLARRNKSRFL